jgi:hypothetical protein
MFWKKSQKRLDFDLWWSAWHGYTDDVRKSLAAGANVHASDDAALQWAEDHDRKETVRVLREAIEMQDAQAPKEKLELERQRNPLLAGTGLRLAEYGPKDIETLLREAMAEQEQVRCPARAGALRRDYLPFPQP